MKEETRTIKIPFGYELDRVEDGEVILKKKEVKLLKNYTDCLNSIKFEGFSQWYINVPVPIGMVKPIYSLCRLLICRNAWWQQLEYNPDWNDKRTLKYCIYEVGSGAVVSALQITTHSTFPRILAFPTYEIAKDFLETFRDIIEEAKELL